MEFITYKIIDERKEEGTPTNPKPVGAPNENNPIKTKDVISSGMDFTLLKKMGQEGVNIAIGHIGDFTGSSNLQNKVNASAQLVGTAISIAKNPAMGIATLALQIANKAIDIAKEKRMDAINVSEARKRAGVSFNQSRM